VREQYAGLRARRLGPALAIWSVLALVAGVTAANDPRYGPWYLFAGPIGYAVAQWMFRLSRNVEGAPPRKRNWLFVP
jgi:hypothetical protein